MKRLLLRLIPLSLEHLGVHFAVVPLGHQIRNFPLLGLLEDPVDVVDFWLAKKTPKLLSS